MLRLPPIPAPTLASEAKLCCAAPSSVRTADFSASALDFAIVAATCVCTLPVCAARNPLTRLITSIGIAPGGLETNRLALTNAGTEWINCPDLPRRDRLGAAIVVEAAL